MEPGKSVRAAVGRILDEARHKFGDDGALANLTAEDRAAVYAMLMDDEVLQFLTDWVKRAPPADRIVALDADDQRALWSLILRERRSARFDPSVR